MTTKEQILKCFKDIDHAYNDCTRYDTLKCMLDELQGPCEDAISRQGVAEVLFKYVRPGDDVGKRFVEFLLSQINALPSVTPQEPCDKCVYSTSEGCQYDDITETIPPFEDCDKRRIDYD